jgi:hypothetical protein
MAEKPMDSMFRLHCALPLPLPELGDKVEAFRASGFAGYNIWLFVVCSIIARGGRFFAVAILLNRYGDTIRASIEKRLGLWVALGAMVLVLGFVIAFRML